MPCYTIKCGYCGRFCIPTDSETPFGCADPEDPEPYDPTFFCDRCTTRLETSWEEAFARGSRSGDWMKSDAEMKAAKMAGLEWVHENGLVDTRTGNEVYYRYIVTAEKHFYVPFLEYQKARRTSAILS